MAHLDCYLNLEHTSQQMVAAAQQSDWATVERLELQALQQVKGIRAAPPQTHTNQGRGEARHQALLAILRHDAQVRALAEPGWEKIEGYLRWTETSGGQVDGCRADIDNTDR